MKIQNVGLLVVLWTFLSKYPEIRPNVGWEDRVCNSLPTLVRKLPDKRNAICGWYYIFAEYFHIHKPGVCFSHQPDLALSAVWILRRSRAKRRCAALGWSIKLGSLCCKCKADGSAGIPAFCVNTISAFIGNKTQCPYACWLFPHSESHDAKSNRLWMWTGYGRLTSGDP